MKLFINLPSVHSGWCQFSRIILLFNTVSDIVWFPIHPDTFQKLLFCAFLSISDRLWALQRTLVLQTYFLSTCLPIHLSIACYEFLSLWTVIVPGLVSILFPTTNKYFLYFISESYFLLYLWLTSDKMFVPLKALLCLYIYFPKI